MAPARRAAACGLAPAAAQDAREGEVHALQRPEPARPSAGRADGAGPRSARRRSRSASAARRCSGRRSPSGDRCTGGARISPVRIRARASPFTSIPSSCPTWYTSSRACHFGTAPARMSLGAISGFRVSAVIPRRSLCCRTIPKSPSLRLRPSQTNTFIGVRSRWSICPRCSFPSTWRMPAISRRAVRSGQPLPVRCRNALQVAVTRVLEREAVEDAAVRAHEGKACRRRGSPADGRPAAARSTPRAATRRCAR